jgi:hypothetical protein
MRGLMPACLSAYEARELIDDAFTEDRRNAAIPSIMAENCRDESFAFRRFHIARLLGIDIAKRRELIERAVESYIRWTELVERQRPLFTLRVEYLFEELSAHEEDLAAAGIKLNWEFREAAQGGRHDINASSMRYSIEKPMIAPAQYRALPKDLAYALTAYCFRYRYRMPGAEDYTHISAV